MATTYRRTTHYECDELEKELVVMERDSETIVMLNHAGYLIWEAIENPVTRGELEAAFCDSFPDLGRASIHDNVGNVLDALITAGLAFREKE